MRRKEEAEKKVSAFYIWLLYGENMLFTGIKNVFEVLKAWQKQGTESEFKEREWISVVGLGWGVRGGTWKFTSSTQNLWESTRPNVCPLSWLGCFTYWIKLKESNSLIKSEANEAEEGQQTWILKSPRIRTLSYWIAEMKWKVGRERTACTEVNSMIADLAQCPPWTSGNFPKKKQISRELGKTCFCMGKKLNQKDK